MDYYGFIDTLDLTSCVVILSVVIIVFIFSVVVIIWCYLNHICEKRLQRLKAGQIQPDRDITATTSEGTPDYI